MPDWNPQAYLTFANERQRPAVDLLARVPLENPALICDLGSGPGNSTALLRTRYAKARIIGIESSPAMVTKARGTVPSAEFYQTSVEQWAPDPEADLIFSNALFQWLPHHLQLWSTYLDHLKPGAVLAIQMPDNLGEPSHRLMAETASDSKWRSKIPVPSRKKLHQPTEYYAKLSAKASSVEIWRTTYHHVLKDHQAIAEFFGSTGLKTYLDHLSTDDQQAFTLQYVDRLKQAYPALTNGRVLLALPRLFIVVIK
jgi:trans-aconitate 2-methyltransferase